MPTTYTPLATTTLQSSSNTVTFSSISGAYTDIVAVISASVSGPQDIYCRFNSDANGNYSDTHISGTGSSALSGRDTSATRMQLDSYGYPETTAGNHILIANFMNYSNTTVNKAVLTRSSNSQNGTTALVGLWRSTAAITNIDFICGTGAATFSSGSTFSLYGVASAAVVSGAKATGGDVIATDGTYWYHAFRSSGTFTPTSTLSCDVLVVAGGGGGGADAYTAGNRNSGGGGAGGIFYATSQSLSSAQTVTIGAGGAGSSTGQGSDGSNSSLGSLTVGVGGGGGGGHTTVINLVGRTGGSGGGGSNSANGGGTSQTGTGGTGYGNIGGLGGNQTGAGGGGAGAVGGAGAPTASSPNGNGGAGLNTWSAWATATGTGVSGFFGGGGGGGGLGSTNVAVGGSGGSGGGGAGSGSSTGTAGTTNTGGGGGGGGSQNLLGGAGGSGIVIVRYSV